MKQLDIANKIKKQYKYGDVNFNFCDVIDCKNIDCQFRRDCLSSQFSIVKFIDWINNNDNIN